MRAFIAIEIGETAREALTEFQSRLQAVTGESKSVKWTQPAQFHLTLYFLGDVDAGDLNEIEIVLNEATKDMPPLRLSLIESGCFPSPKRPSIWWTGVGGDSAQLEKLQCEVQTRVERFGKNHEKRPFHPHLTIARIRVPKTTLHAAWNNVTSTHPLPLASWRVDAIILLESRLSSSGAEYVERLRVPLRGG
mgnify:CR=1 FL=1